MVFFLEEKVKTSLDGRKVLGGVALEGGGQFQYHLNHESQRKVNF